MPKRPSKSGITTEKRVKPTEELVAQLQAVMPESVNVVTKDPEPPAEAPEPTVLADEPVKKDPKDFSDFEPIMRKIRGESDERFTLLQSMGYDTLVLDGFEFLVKHPKIKQRRHVIRGFLDLGKAEEAPATGEEAVAQAERALDRIVNLALPLLYVDDTGGDPRPATFEEVETHLDTPDVMKIISIVVPELDGIADGTVDPN